MLDNFSYLSDSLHFNNAVPGWVLIVLAIIITGALLYTIKTDLSERIIPNYITYPGIVGSIIAAPLVFEDWQTHYIAGILSTLVFFGLGMVKIRGNFAFGMGDAKLYSWAGFMLGQGVVIVMLVASLLGILVGIPAAISSNEKIRDYKIPHGPQIVVGIIFTAIIALSH